MLCLIFKYCIAGYHVVWFLAGEPRDPPAQEALPTSLPGMQAYKGTGSGIFFLMGTACTYPLFLNGKVFI